MNRNSPSAWKRIVAAWVLQAGLVLGSHAFAADTAKLVAKDDGSGGVVAEFETLGTCSSKSEGVNGCLSMGKNQKGILTIIFIDQTAAQGWSLDRMQIRKPYNNWNTADSVDADILSDFQALGGGNYFNANGERVFTGPSPVVHFMDLNQHEFIVQYRVAIKKDDEEPIWAHPIIDNEGID